jgi:hypothetical protein
VRCQHCNSWIIIWELWFYHCDSLSDKTGDGPVPDWQIGTWKVNWFARTEWRRRIKW